MLETAKVRPRKTDRDSPQVRRGERDETERQCGEAQRVRERGIDSEASTQTDTAIRGNLIYSMWAGKSLHLIENYL